MSICHPFLPNLLILPLPLSTASALLPLSVDKLSLTLAKANLVLDRSSAYSRAWLCRSPLSLCPQISPHKPIGLLPPAYKHPEMFFFFYPKKQTSKTFSDCSSVSSSDPFPLASFSIKLLVLSSIIFPCYLHFLGSLEPTPIRFIPESIELALCPVHEQLLCHQIQ